jgi:hypothetical protein
MTRKRYIWDDEVKDLVEITPGYEPSRKGKDAANHLGSLWGDRHYDGLRATDGADISTRKKHRDYMRKMGLTTADDYKSDWAKAQKAREHYMQHGGSIRRQDVERVIEKLQNRR